PDPELLVDRLAVSVQAGDEHDNQRRACRVRRERNTSCGFTVDIAFLANEDRARINLVSFSLPPEGKRRGATPVGPAPLRITEISHRGYFFATSSSAACPAARRAIGTRNGLQLT